MFHFLKWVFSNAGTGNQHDIPVKTSSNRHEKKLGKLIAAILMLAQISSLLPFLGQGSWSASPANAVLYSPDTKVRRTGELALRAIQT